MRRTKYPGVAQVFNLKAEARRRRSRLHQAEPQPISRKALFLGFIVGEVDDLKPDEYLLCERLVSPSCDGVNVCDEYRLFKLIERLLEQGKLVVTSRNIPDGDGGEPYELIA